MGKHGDVEKLERNCYTALINALHLHMNVL